MVYIEKLLASNDHVVVPGLGAFLVQYSSARIENGLLIPPSATVSFNPLICDTDGALAIEISRNQKISYKASNELIRSMVQSLHTELADKNVVFGKIGTFTLSSENKPIFVPSERPVFLPANFANHNIRLDEITSKLQNRHPQKHRWRHYAAAILVFCSLFIPGKVNHNHPILEANLNLFKSVVHEPTQITTQSEDAQVELAPVTTRTYKVIVAVYQSHSNALLLLEKILATYPSAEILADKNDYKVTVMTNHSLTEAVNYMEQIRRTDSQFPDAWVMKF